MSAPPRTTRPPTTPRGPVGPDPDRLARLLTQVWFEVRSGRRPFAQLAPLVAPALRRRLLAQLPRGPWTRPPPVARIHRVISASPSTLAHEASVLVEQDGRITAVAVRLERHHGAWRAVELTAPEAGLTPLVTASHPTYTRPRDAFDEVLEEA